MISDLLPENLKGAVVELIPYFRGQFFSAASSRM